MAEEEMEPEVVVEEPQGGGPGKKLIIGGLAVILAAVGGLAFVFLSPGSSEESATTEPVAVPGKPPLYASLHPPLVVNFEDMNGATHFMQITMEVMARDQSVINAVREHTPVIRNNLILLYGNAVYEQITTRKGKEQMLADGLAEIQNVMKQQIGETGVEAVYFTSLIIQ